MKRYILIIMAVSMLMASCENDVDVIWSDSNEAMLVLNSLIKQDETSHKIVVYCSEGSHCTSVTDADVSCSINGGAPVKAVFDPVSESDWDDVYVLDAALSAGDKLLVKAQWKNLSAEAKVTVAESAGTISKVEAKETVVEDSYIYGGHKTVMQYSISMDDKAGEDNYYRLYMCDVFNRFSAGGKLVESFSCKAFFDGSGDPILNPIGGQASEMMGYDNDFNVFTDEMFAGGSCVIKVQDNQFAAYDQNWMDFWNRFEEGDSYSVDRMIKVYTISFDEFIYTKALGGNLLDIDFMTEPIIYPENVTGGLGFVSVSTPSVYKISGQVLPWEGTIPGFEEPDYGDMPYYGE